MKDIQIVPITDKVCTLYRLYQGQTRYTEHIVPRTDKVCTLNILDQGQTRYVHCKDRQGMYAIQIVPRTDFTKKRLKRLKVENDIIKHEGCQQSTTSHIKCNVNNKYVTLPFLCF